MAANDSQFSLSYLNKLVDKYFNAYRNSVNRRPINSDYPALTQNLRPILELLRLKLMIEPELLSIKIFFRKGYIENWLGKIFIINSVSKNMHHPFCIIRRKKLQI